MNDHMNIYATKWLVTYLVRGNGKMYRKVFTDLEVAQEWTDTHPNCLFLAMEMV